MTLAASAIAPLPEEARAVDDVDLAGSGGDDGRRACYDIGRQRHGAPSSVPEDRKSVG